METSTLILIASLGSIAVLLLLYICIFMFERKCFLALWFVGWSMIALCYLVDVLYPNLLRQNRLTFELSLCLYFSANLLISWGTLLFLKTKVKPVHIIGITAAWLILFTIFTLRNIPDLLLIQYTYLTVFVLSTLVGIVMIKSSERHGKYIMVLGSLNLVWVCINLIFTYILQMPHMAPYVVSQIILVLNAVGLVQLYFKEQKNAIQEGLDHITYLTLHDGLTGLYNKTYFDNKLAEMENNDDYLPVSLIIGDMNRLKFFNDVFGHHEGDRKLKQIADIIRRSCRESDIIARWGGDEFAIILPNTDNETANAIRDKISAACNDLQGPDLLLSMSLGAATKIGGNASLSMVLKRSEELMYRAKLTEGMKVRGAISEILGKVLRENDLGMKEHTERLQVLARKFAMVLDFSPQDLKTLERAAALHDIGKIGISRDMSCNNSVSGSTEWSVMRKHAEIGYRIAQASGELAYLADIILYHHEWWNGRGYPQGLRGEEIPLMSRIISILDAFDNMTHQLQGKPTVTAEEALLELECGAGSQFDPSLVRLFVRMMRELACPKAACLCR